MSRNPVRPSRWPGRHLRAKEVELGKLTLTHVDEWNKQLEEAGIENPILSPILLPDYTRKVR